VDVPWARGASQNFGFSFNICATAEASNNYLLFPFNISAMVHCPLIVTVILFKLWNVLIFLNYCWTCVFICFFHHFNQASLNVKLYVKARSIQSLKILISVSTHAVLELWHQPVCCQFHPTSAVDPNGIIHDCALLQLSLSSTKDCRNWSNRCIHLNLDQIYNW